MSQTSREPVQAGHNQRSKRSLRARIGRLGAALVLGLALLTGVAVVVSYWMWRAVPDYWVAAQAFHDGADDQELAELAEAGENRAAMELSNADTGPGDGSEADSVELHTLELSYKWMNAWLAHRLEPWLEHQQLTLPEGIDRPMVAAHRGSLVLAFRARLPELDQVMSIVFDIELLDDGRARLVWRRTLAGRLPLPGPWVKQQVVERVAEYADYELDSRALAELAALLDGEPFDPQLNIDSSRRARLVDIGVDEVGVELTMRIEPRRRSSAAAPFSPPPTP